MKLDLNIDFQQKLQELQAVNWNDPGQWPFFIKLTGVFAICIALLFAGFWFDVKGQWEAYGQAQAEEQTLRDQFTNKKGLAVNLPAYQQQMELMEQTFGTLLRQLPDSTEVPSLLVDITQAGLGRGLNFVLFKPGAEQKKGFYAVLPISIRVTGKYHELAGFVSDVAALPRIVTIDDIQIASGKGGQLSISATAYTYRYLTPQEQAAATAAEAQAKQKTRRR